MSRTPGAELDADLRQLAPYASELAASVSPTRVAIAQEWISGRAGSEKVFEALGCLLPSADLFALSSRPGVIIESSGRPIRTTFLDTGFFRSNLAVSLPLMPLAWKSMSVERYDLAITSSHAFSRCFSEKHSERSLSYVHSPLRYIWYPEIDERSVLARAIGRLGAFGVLQRIDRRTADRTDSIACNSETTQARVAEKYDRSSRIIHPPVATKYYSQKGDGDRRYLLAVSRFVPYKRLDLAIQVAAEIGQPLIIAGTGPDLPRLRALAATLGATVSFVLEPTDDQLRDLYRNATALLFLATEDFGIVPVEAQAAGCPVVTCGRGGALETVVEGVTGFHAASLSLDDLVEAATKTTASQLDSGACRHNASRFSYARFGERAVSWIGECLSDGRT